MSFLKDLLCCGRLKDVVSDDLGDYGQNSPLHRQSDNSTVGSREYCSVPLCPEDTTLIDSNQILISDCWPCRTCDVLCFSPERFEEHRNTEDHKSQIELYQRFDISVKNFTKPNGMDDFRGLQIFDINAPKAGLSLTKNGINFNSISINYDELAEFTVNLEAPLNFVLNQYLDFGDNNKTLLKALNITDSGFGTKPQTSTRFDSSDIQQIDLENALPSGSQAKTDVLESYLRLEVVETEDYVTVNRKIKLQLKNWHCIIGSVAPHCYLCNLPVDNFNNHVKSGNHLCNLKNRKSSILAKYGNNLIMMLPSGDFHCGICNIRGLNTSTIDLHITSQHHLNYYAQAESKFKKLNKAPKASEIKPTELQFKITSLVYATGKGVLLNDKVLFLSNNWNACSVRDKKKLYCIICDKLIERSDGPRHWQSASHLQGMGSMPLLNQFGHHAIRRISDNFVYCTVCGENVGDTPDVPSHIQLDSHKDKYAQCIDGAKQVIEQRIQVKKLR